jgi:hypothetical protein
MQTPAEGFRQLECFLAYASSLRVRPQSDRRMRHGWSVHDQLPLIAIRFTGL